MRNLTTGLMAFVLAVFVAGSVSAQETSQKKTDKVKKEKLWLIQTSGLSS